MGLDVDDTNSAIQYSSGWTTRPASQQYQGTGHATSQTGASLTFTFSGTAIRMICTVPAGTNQFSRAQVSLDGGSPRLLEHTTHPSDFYNDQWYDSGSLSNGQHTITVTNPGGSSAAAFVLDKFNIDGAIVSPDPGPAAAAAAAAPPTPTTTSTTTTPRVITSTQVVVATRVTTTEVVISGSTTRVATVMTTTSTSTGTSIVSRTSDTSSSSSTSTSKTTSSQSTHSNSEKTVTAVLFLTTSTAVDGSVSTQTTTPPPVDSSSATSTSERPLGLIIGSVLGGIAVILLLLLLLVCIRRRNRSTHIKLPDDREARPSRTINTAVTPFHLERSGSGASHGGEPTSNTGHPRTSESGGDPPYTAGAGYLARNNSEKSGELGYPNTNRNDTPMSIYSPSSDPANDPFVARAFRLPPIDTGVGAGTTAPGLSRPGYLSGDTVAMAPPSTGIYARTPADTLGPVDSRDVPPAYQSVRNTNSGASFPPVGAPLNIPGAG